MEGKNTHLHTWVEDAENNVHGTEYCENKSLYLH